jgi:hypothetical protein
MLLAALAWMAGEGRADAQLGALLSPGELAKAHAALEGIANCQKCHEQGKRITAEKCLSCHKPVADRIAAKIGVHRDVRGDCVTCHVEHAGKDGELRPFDQAAFDHARVARFPLDGKHADLAGKCAACHKTRSFLTASATCQSCHVDVHKGKLGSGCESCHTTRVAFKDVVSAGRFDHGKSAFPLLGAHKTVTCEKCHAGGAFKGVAFASCASCHKDPHRSRLGATCASCHTETDWRTTKVDHARTAFPLLGKHATVTCAKCHVKPAAIVKPPAATCAVCHTDPHRGTFKQDCAACHTESSFQKGTFDHATTKFPLVDKHAGVACVACHKTSRPVANDFKGQKTSCDSCHADVHRGELGLSCEKCHSARSWEVKPFAHAKPRTFFDGQHAPLACADCHKATMQPTRTGDAVTLLRVGFTTTPTACASCHKDVHLGQLAQACETCHPVETPKFRVTEFAHGATTFPLTGKHAPLACDACHKVETGAFPAGHGTARRLKGVARECASCHQDPHRGQLNKDCQTCHATDTFSLPRYTHKNVRSLRTFFAGRHLSASCAACHKPLARTAGELKVVANYSVSTGCTTCHTDVHKGALGPICETCHKP